MTGRTAASARRVCYFGAYRAEYSRNRIMMEGLRRNGVQVIACHESLWHGVEDRVQATRGGWKRPGFLWRVLRTYARLLWRGLRLRGRYDVMVVGYPGQFDVYLARLLSWLHGKPLVWDIFMSIYLIAVERGLDKASPWTVNLLRGIERLALRLPDRLIMDTAPYVAWLEATHGVAADRFGLVPTGADSTIFMPDSTCMPDSTVEILQNGAAQSEGGDKAATGAQPFRVLYHGTFIPNHGVPTIVQAAQRLASEAEPDSKNILFEFIGDGPDRTAVQQFAQAYGLTNVVFTEWLAPEAVPARLAQADLCLGVFGVTPQSLMTVQNKIYEGLAMGKPVLTGDGPAVRAALQHGEHVYLCPRADAAALAQAIRTLRADSGLRARLAQQGYAHFLAHFTVEHLGQQFRAVLEDVLEELMDRM